MMYLATFHYISCEAGVEHAHCLIATNCRSGPGVSPSSLGRCHQGFCNFYRRFIRRFSQIAKPLNNLLKKGTKWLWGMEEIGAFEKLKKQICKEPVLLQPDQKKPFEVEVDASNYACGTVLMQHNDKNTLHPVAFFFKTMNEAQCNYNCPHKCASQLSPIYTCLHNQVCNC